MRIGILTLHSGTNYGGTLQCVALFNVLKCIGHEVEVINFVPAIEASLWQKILYNISTVRNIKSLIAFFKKIGLGRKAVNTQNINTNLVPVFDNFRKESIQLSEMVNEITISTLNERYDVIVVGSDQVWGSLVRSHLTYLGDWSPKFSGQFFSYAACAISLNYPLVRRKNIQNHLNNFRSITVRDTLTKQLVEHLSINKSKVVADPTLLYDFSGYTSKPIISEPYIFVYILGEEIGGGNITAINFIKEKIGRDCKVIASTIYNDEVKYADITIKDAKPSDWVNYIAHSKCVYTDSFHGVLFSLKFNKRFVAYYTEQSRASRFIDLIERFDCKSNVISSLCELADTELDRPLNKLDRINMIVEESKRTLKEMFI